MIPIRIQRDSIIASDIEDLEYSFLQEIPKEIVDKFNEVGEKGQNYDYGNNKLLELFTDNRFDVYRYIGTIGDTNLFKFRNRLYKANLTCDFLEGGYSNWGFALTDDVLKDMVGKRFDSDYNTNGFIFQVFEKYENTEICIGDFIQRFLALIYKSEKAKEKQEKVYEQQRVEKIKGNNDEKESFEKGIWQENNQYTYGSGNTIHHSNNDYVYDEDINKIFTLEELNRAVNSYSSHYGSLNVIESLSIEKEVNYTNRTYKVKFDDSKMYVDNVCIPKGRSVFFVSRADGTEETIKKFKELSAIKVAFLGTKSIEISTPSYTYRNIPLEVEYKDKIWEVTLLDKTIKADWKDLGFFKESTQNLKTYFRTYDLDRMRTLFGIDKADLLNFMKKTQLLDKLGEED